MTEYWLLDTSPQMRAGKLSECWYGDTDLAVCRELRRRVPQSDSRSHRFGVVSHWNSATTIQCSPNGPFLDSICGSAACWIISSRFRALLMKLAPRQIQYLPVTPTSRGRPLPVETYWVANPLYRIDCLHYTKNRRIVPEREPRDQYFLSDRYIDPDRVPIGLNYFYALGGTLYPIVSGEIKAALRKAKITPVRFSARRLVPDKSRPSPSYARRSFEEFERMVGLVVPDFSSVTPRESSITGALSKPTSNDLLGLIRYAVARGDLTAGHPVAARDVDKLQRVLGVALPREIRAVVIEFGGLQVAGEEMIGSVTDEDSAESIACVHASFVAYPGIRWPTGVVGIAADGRGGGFCLDIPSSTDGDCPVMYFDHEAMTPNKQTGELVPRFERVAPSFAAWVKRAIRTQSPFAGTKR